MHVAAPGAGIGGAPGGKLRMQPLKHPARSPASAGSTVAPSPTEFASSSGGSPVEPLENFDGLLQGNGVGQHSLLARPAEAGAMGGMDSTPAPTRPGTSGASGTARRSTAGGAGFISGVGFPGELQRPGTATMGATVLPPAHSPGAMPMLISTNSAPSASGAATVSTPMRPSTGMANPHKNYPLYSGAHGVNSTSTVGVASGPGPTQHGRSGDRRRSSGGDMIALQLPPGNGPASSSGPAQSPALAGPMGINTGAMTGANMSKNSITALLSVPPGLAKTQPLPSLGLGNGFVPPPHPTAAPQNPNDSMLAGDNKYDHLETEWESAPRQFSVSTTQRRSQVQKMKTRPGTAGKMSTGRGGGSRPASQPLSPRDAAVSTTVRKALPQQRSYRPGYSQNSSVTVSPTLGTGSPGLEALAGGESTFSASHEYDAAAEPEQAQLPLAGRGSSTSAPGDAGRASGNHPLELALTVSQKERGTRSEILTDVGTLGSTTQSQSLSASESYPGTSMGFPTPMSASMPTGPNSLIGGSIPYVASMSTGGVSPQASHAAQQLQAQHQQVQANMRAASARAPGLDMGALSVQPHASFHTPQSSHVVLNKGYGLNRPPSPMGASNLLNPRGMSAGGMMNMNTPVSPSGGLLQQHGLSLSSSLQADSLLGGGASWTANASNGKRPRTSGGFNAALPTESGLFPHIRTGGDAGGSGHRLRRSENHGRHLQLPGGGIGASALLSQSLTHLPGTGRTVGGSYTGGSSHDRRLIRTPGAPPHRPATGSASYGASPGQKGPADVLAARSVSSSRGAGDTLSGSYHHGRHRAKHTSQSQGRKGSPSHHSSGGGSTGRHGSPSPAGSRGHEPVATADEPIKMKLAWGSNKPKEPERPQTAYGQVFGAAAQRSALKAMRQEWKELRSEEDPPGSASSLTAAAREQMNSTGTTQKGLGVSLPRSVTGGASTPALALGQSQSFAHLTAGQSPSSSNGPALTTARLGLTPAPTRQGQGSAAETAQQTPARPGHEQQASPLAFDPHDGNADDFKTFADIAGRDPNSHLQRTGGSTATASGRRQILPNEVGTRPRQNKIYRPRKIQSGALASTSGNKSSSICSPEPGESVSKSSPLGTGIVGHNPQAMATSKSMGFLHTGGLPGSVAGGGVRTGFKAYTRVTPENARSALHTVALGFSTPKG